MLPDEKIKCHHTGFKRRCRDIVTEDACCKWAGIIGKDPTTGELVNKYGCADAYAHMLLVQMTMSQNGVAASCDKATNETRGFRNDMRSVNGLPELPMQELPAQLKIGN